MFWHLSFKKTKTRPQGATFGVAAEQFLEALAVHASGGPGRDGDKRLKAQLYTDWRTELAAAVAAAVSVQTLRHVSLLCAAARGNGVPRTDGAVFPSPPVFSGLALPPLVPVSGPGAEVARAAVFPLPAVVDVSAAVSAPSGAVAAVYTI